MGHPGVTDGREFFSSVRTQRSAHIARPQACIDRCRFQTSVKHCVLPLLLSQDLADHVALLLQQTPPLSPAAPTRRSSAAATPRSPLGAAQFGVLSGQHASMGERQESQPYGAEASAAAEGGDGVATADVAPDAGWDPEGQPAAAEWGGIDPTGDAAWQQPEQPQPQPEGQAWDVAAAEQQQWNGAAQEAEPDAAAAQAAAPEVYSDEQVLKPLHAIRAPALLIVFKNVLLWPGEF